MDEKPREGSLTSVTAAERVRAARQIQLRRAGKLNSDLTSREMQDACRLGADCRRLLAHARARLEFSARAVHRVLRVARTIADLAERATIGADHLAEALQLRRAIS